MRERLLPLQPGRRTGAGAFATYVALITLAAIGGLLVLGATSSWHIEHASLFATLSVFVLAGELLPIPVPRREDLAFVTISTAFAFALLLRFGAGPATLVYVGSLLVGEVRHRTAPIKVLFNAAQYALAMEAAAAVLSLLGSGAPIPVTASELPIILAAGMAFFAVNHLLACTAAALLAELPVIRYMRDDLFFKTWTEGCLLAFAPAVLAAANTSTVLVPVTFLPMLAIYIGGRQAAVNMHRAFHDALTDLPNRLMLSQRLASAVSLAEADGHSIGVMILDLDDFKAINDTLGHEFGDSVLQRVAMRLEQAVGAGATLARLGGDEFAAVVPGGIEETEACARALLGALDHPLVVESLALQVTGTIGFACFPQHGRSTQDLLRHADVALYWAKASDEPIRGYAQEQDDYTIDRLALAAQLRRGMERGELVVDYQPKVSLHEHRTHAVEALARWEHPQLGRLAPAAFIPLAEQSGLIKLLTERVLEAALRQCGQWREDGLEIRVSVNVSTRSLLDQELPSVIRELLARFGLPPSLLQLEITESRTVTDLGRARAVLEELRSIGVTVAIDDFGTGFSSLSQLQQLPIDEIKIDRSFVMRMDEQRSDAMLVRSIIELTRSLGLRVTAEGVETETALHTLRQLGCDFAQGFHLCRPLVPDQCRRYFEAAPAAAPIPLAAVAEPGRMRG